MKTITTILLLVLACRLDAAARRDTLPPDDELYALLDARYAALLEAELAEFRVGNKGTDDDDSDIRQLTLLMDSVWKVAERPRSQEERQRLATQIRERARQMEHTFRGVPEAVVVMTPMDASLRSSPNPVPATSTRTTGRW